MKKTGKKPTLVLLGSGRGAYFAAKAFYEAYHGKAYVFGAYKSEFTKFCRIIKNKFFSGYRDVSVLLPEIISFGRKRKSEKLILLPCNDIYTDFVSKNEKELSEYYEFIVPKKVLVEKLTDIKELYSLLDLCEIPHFECIFIGKDTRELKMLEKEDGLILLPTSKTGYWSCPFPDMKNAYFPKNYEEALAISRYIFSYGYPLDFALSKSTNLYEKYVYTFFISENARGNFAVFGKIVLEDKRTPGKYLAIVTEEENALCRKLKSFLREVGYRGFGSFYISAKNGSFFVDGFSTAAAVGFDYILACGINPILSLASYFGIADYQAGAEKKKVYWHSARHRTVMRCAKSVKDKMAARSLKKDGMSSFAFGCRGDLRFNPLRRALLSTCMRKEKKQLFAAIKTENG